MNQQLLCWTILFFLSFYRSKYDCAHRNQRKVQQSTVHLRAPRHGAPWVTFLLVVLPFYGGAVQGKQKSWFIMLTFLCFTLHQCCRVWSKQKFDCTLNSDAASSDLWPLTSHDGWHVLKLTFVDLLSNKTSLSYKWSRSTNSSQIELSAWRVLSTRCHCSTKVRILWVRFAVICKRRTQNTSKPRGQVKKNEQIKLPPFSQHLLWILNGRSLRFNGISKLCRRRSPQSAQSQSGVVTMSND